MKTQLQFKKTILLSIISFVFLSLQSQTYSYEDLIERVQNEIRVGIKDAGVLNTWLNAQSADGSWAAFSYGKLNTANAMNTADNHVLRIWHLAATVSKEGHEKYNNTVYKEAIKKGLSYWYKSNTIDPNWWYNRIYCPQKLGEILLFMRELNGYIPRSAPGDEIDEERILSLLQPQAISDVTLHGTGANAIDIALHYVYRGLLTENSSLLEGMRDFLTPTLAENIKSDLIYQDHGPQIQISSYGYVFADGIIRLASYLAGTPAAFDIRSEYFDKVVRFIRETQLTSIRGSQWDFSVMGRGVSRENALVVGLNYMQKMADFIDPDHARVYTDALTRIRDAQSIGLNIEKQNKHYWASDYTQHIRSEYLFTVRNVSNRTVEAETGNDENLKANYFSYGATFISVDGSEYKNIMPYWDWCMIPGTTFPYTTDYPARSGWGVNFGSTSFVGGVSDGKYGASVINMNKSGMRAKKSWFFFDEEIICLGAGISDNSNREVRTSLNQAIMKAPSYIKETSGTSEVLQNVSSNTYSNSNLLYLRNGKIAYFFPNQGNVKYSMKSQKGTWKSINSSGSASEVSGYVLSLWFDHGVNPVNSSYSYIVVPGVDTEARAKAYDHSAVEIIENTSSVQAVAHKHLNIIQIIFHEAGTLTYLNRAYTANQPCALMIKNGTLVSIADPSQSKSTVEVKIDVDGTVYQNTMILPDGDMKGSTITKDFGISSDMETQSILGEELSCFPNPTIDGLLTVNTTIDRPLSCEVRNNLGIKILKKEFNTEATIDLKNYPPGIYYLSFLTDNKRYNRKIIKL